MAVMHVDAARKNLGQAGFMDLDVDPRLDLFKEIQRLKKQKNAILLAHYYLSLIHI